MSKAMDKKLFYKAKEKIGQPWTYTAKTQAKLDADKAAAAEIHRLPSEYQPVQKMPVAPKKAKPLQQLNGRRSQCLGYKDTFHVGSQRTLPPVPKDYVAVARAKRIKKHTSKLRKAP